MALSKCADVGEARALISRVVLTGERFEPELPSAKLHWLIADRNDCIVVESTKDGLHIYDNQFGVLTNEPEFPVQAAMMNSYANLTPKPAVNRSGMPLTLNSRGMGGIGLPGDLTSMSRFARAAFVRANSKSAYTEEAGVSQFFHILGAVEQQKGLCELDGGECEYTIYTSCVNADKGFTITAHTTGSAPTPWICVARSSTARGLSLSRWRAGRESRDLTEQMSNLTRVRCVPCPFFCNVILIWAGYKIRILHMAADVL